ncbi:glycosyltransferase [Gluconobacter cerinus]|uniref:Glycosyl transferase n=1 Tax=Gluconobacter cerinus TaxID=38307 RepID=A0A1B6VJE5_9PROT|nr:glycosyltransferase [Gluconobacter cerinus]OAJ67168.1 glycosyl transferase [Gluconobacter cerinus]
MTPKIIRREQAKNSLAFNGERFTSDISGQIEVEHYHRYLMARQFCTDCVVLDVASGEGYGAAMIAQVAQFVQGVDIDGDTVNHAAREFTRPNLRFACGDATKLPVEDHSFDRFLSFETIEHVEDHDAFLSEIKRSLRSDGLLIISSPDKDVYSAVGEPDNPFHVHELTRINFLELLQKNFRHVALLIQKPMIGSVILAEERSNCAPLVFEKRNADYFEVLSQPSHAPYLIAFASDEPLPEIPDSFYIHRTDLDTDMTERLAQARRAIEAEQRLNETLDRVRELDAAQIECQKNADISCLEDVERYREEAAQLRNEIERAYQELSSRDASFMAKISQQQSHIASLHGRQMHAEAQLLIAQKRLRETEDLLENIEIHQTSAREADSRAWQADAEASRILVRRLSDELEQARNHINAFQRSLSWRVSAPIRVAARISPRSARLARMAAKAVWWTATGQLAHRLRLRRAYHEAITQEIGKAGHDSVSALAPPDGYISSEKIEASDMVLAPFVIPTSHKPVVSVIIPAYGQDAVTYRCLRSFADHLPDVPFEIILADDAYPYDGHEPRLPEIVSGVRHIRHQNNLGFLESCNAAARLAVGEYIFFLNNDTEILKNSLDALVGLLDRDPSVGMTGSKLVYPDGSLQEAGGIIWGDASGWNWGRNGDPSQPEFNYTREVDYISGAAIMIRRSLFEALEGFDPHFAPAYYEDTDLAFRVRNAGFKVVYAPRSVVIHHEGVSHGTDLTSGIKARQAINQKLMCDRWRDVLADNHYPNSADLYRAVDRARNKRVVLVIDHYVPEPDRDAGSRTITNVIECLIQSGFVVKFWPQNRAYSPLYTAALQDMGVEVVDHRWHGGFVEWLDERGDSIDLVLVSRPSIAFEFLPALCSRPNLKLIFYGHDLHFDRMRREAKLKGDKALYRASNEMEQLERRLWRLFDRSLYLSTVERDHALSLEPNADIRAVVPYCYRYSRRREAVVEGQTILFVAGFAHPPNEDAAHFLVECILPLVQQKYPDARVLLVGSHPTAAVMGLAGPSVEVTGWVSDDHLRRYYETSRVAIVPLRFGAGVKGKVVEALHYGLPLITTSIGAEGIEGLEQILCISDSAQDLANGIITLLSDDERWLAQSCAQTEFAEKKFSFDAMRKSLEAALFFEDEHVEIIPSVELPVE